MNLRILSSGLLLVAASVLWMAVGTAAATVVTSPPGTVYTSTIKAEAEGHVVLDNPIAKIECASAVEGKVESHGEGVTVGGKISALSFTGCTNSWHVTVVSAGSLEIHALGEGNGTLTSSGATVEATRFGVTCRYATSNTDIGTLTSGEPATMDINASIPFHSGSFLCGSGATSWTGSYKVTTPTSLTLAEATLEHKVYFEGVAQPNPECEFEKAEIEVEVCKVEFKVTGKGKEKWKIVKSELINGAGQFKSEVGCTKGKELEAGNSCTDVLTNIKNEAAEATWCVEIEVPAGGAGPHCTNLRKK